jgi:hypothetical protein
MMKFRVLTLALAARFVLSVAVAQATTIIENFSTNPLQNGWKIFGDTNLFQWDSINRDLRVTWDSSQPNSYFYRPLGTILTRDDDFTLAFDLELADIGPGPDLKKASTFEIALGFIDLDVATQTNFLRGTGTNSLDLAEFDYFWDSGFGATISPTFVDTNGTFNYNSSSDYAIYALTTGDWYHVVMNYTASNQTMVATVTNFEKTTGVQITQLVNSSFSDYRLGTLSINSYNDTGQEPPQYAGSVLAHGVVANFVVNLPSPPVQDIASTFSNGVWRAEFIGRTNWLYTLERTTDFQTWTSASSASGNGTNLVLQDSAPPPGKSFYRVNAQRP